MLGLGLELGVRIGVRRIGVSRNPNPTQVTAVIEANEKSLKVLYNMLGLGSGAGLGAGLAKVLYSMLGVGLGLGSGLVNPDPNSNQVLYNMYAAADGKNASTG